MSTKDLTAKVRSLKELEALIAEPMSIKWTRKIKENIVQPDWESFRYYENEVLSNCKSR